MSELEQTTNSFSKETATRKEPMSDQKLGNLLAAVGNNEAKSLILLCMENEVVYTKNSLHHQVLEIQGNDPAWIVNTNTARSYCQSSFVPIGLVAEEVTDERNNSYGYVKTDYGEEYGDALAGLLLRLSEENPEHSLYQLFGGGASKHSVKPERQKENEGKSESVDRIRSPLTRLKIFRQLVQKGDSLLREQDLVQTLDESSSKLAKHLEELQRSGIISYSSTLPDTPYAYYALNPDHPESPPTHIKHPSAFQFVYRIFTTQAGEFFRSVDLAKMYVDEFKEKGLDKKHIHHSIQEALFRLGKLGYIKLQEGSFHKGYQSRIDLSPSQQKFLQDLVDTIDRFQQRDPEILKEGKEYAKKLLGNHHRVSLLFQKAKDASPYAQQRPIPETMSNILSIIRDKPNCTSTDIRTQLSAVYGEKLTKNVISTCLRLLNSSDQIEMVAKKKTRYYRVK